MTLEQISADDAKIGFKVQNSFDTEAATIDNFLGAFELEIGTSAESFEVNTRDGTATPHDVLYGVERAGGTIPGSLLTSRQLDLFLGKPNTTSSGGANDNKHTYNPTQYDPEAFSLLVDLTNNTRIQDFNRVVVGMVAENLEIEFPEEAEDVTYSISYQAREDKEVPDADVDSIAAPKEPFVGEEVSWQAEGSPRKDIIDGTLTFEAESFDDYYFQGTDEPHLRDLIAPGNLGISLDLTVHVSNTYWRDKIKNRETISSLTITLDKSSTNRDDTITIELKDGVVENAPIDIPEQGDIEDDVTINFRSYEVIAKDDYTH